MEIVFDSDAEDAEAACDSALEWACALQRGDSQLSYRESGLILAEAHRRQWRQRLKRRDWHRCRLPGWVPKLDKTAEGGYDADVDDEVGIDEASYLRELEQEEKKKMGGTDEESFLLELYDQCQDVLRMIRHDNGIVVDCTSGYDPT